MRSFSMPQMFANQQGGGCLRDAVDRLPDSTAPAKPCGRLLRAKVDGSLGWTPRAPVQGARKNGTRPRARRNPCPV